MLGTTALVSVCAMAVTAAQADTSVIDIAEQELFAAIEELSIETGTPIALNARLVSNKTSKAVVGPMSARQALVAMLDDPSLQVEQRADGGLAVVPVGHLNFVSQDANDATDLGELVLGAATPETGTLGPPPPPFAGGQVATGQQLGVLGNRDRLETPLSTTSLTSEFIKNTQATSYYDVIQILPSLQATTTPNQGITNFNSRGVQVSSADITFNGTSNLFFDTQPTLLGIERVESIRAPAALFTGATSAFASVTGGTLNFVPKRAGPENVNTFTFGYQSDGIAFTQFETEQRYGDQGQFGIYFGAELLDGDTQLSFGERFQGSVALALDYEVENFRAAFDLRYMEVRQDGHSREIFGAMGPDIPTSFSADTNPNQPWAFIDNDTVMAALRLEYDIAPETTIFGAISGARHNRASLTGFPSFIEPNGDFTTNVGSFVDDGNTNFNIEGGIRSNFQLGSVSNAFVAAVSYGEIRQRFSFVGFDPADAFTNNIFDPIVSTPPPFLATDPDFDTTEGNFTGVTVANTFGFLQDQLQLTLGLRYQDIEFKNFDGTTGALLNESSGDRFSPGFAALYRISDTFSVYGSYLEGLRNGGTAPLTAVNAGQQLGPVVSDAIEIGAKFDFGSVGFDAALFQIDDVSTGVDPVTNVFGEVGNSRIRGLELNAFGELTPNLRFVGGLTVYDTEISNSANGAIVGESVAGVPDFVIAANLEYDIRQVEGLTVTAGLRHQADARVIQGNEVEIPDWTTVNLGARYDFNDRITARLSVDNVFDETYFNGTTFGELALGSPRTVRASVSVEF
ncbi:MAG: TonB-dependent receptor [Pseudomonadota bacterium]